MEIGNQPADFIVHLHRQRLHFFQSGHEGIILKAGHGGHLDERLELEGNPGERLAGLVMELPGDAPPLLFLGHQVLPGQLAQSLARLAQPVVEHGVLDGDAELVPDGVEHVDVVGGELAGEAAGHVKHAQHPVPGAERHADKGLEAFGDDQLPVGHPGVVGDVLEENCLAALGDEAGNALAQVDADVPDELLAKAPVGHVGKALVFLVDDEDFPDGAVHDVQGAIEADTEDGIQVPQAAKRRRDTAKHQNLGLLPLFFDLRAARPCLVELCRFHLPEPRVPGSNGVY